MLNPKATEIIASKVDGDYFLYGSEYGHGVYDEAKDFVHRIKEWLVEDK